MVILDAIASVNKSNQYYNEHQTDYQPSSSYKNHHQYSHHPHEKRSPPVQSPSAMNTHYTNHRHYPGKAVDVSLSLEPSSAMGALYEANWAMIRKPQEQASPLLPPLNTSPPTSGNKFTSSAPAPIVNVKQQRRSQQPECHSPPHLRNKQSPQLLTRDQRDGGNSDRESSSSPAGSQNSNGSTTNNNSRLSSLGKYQVTLDQIRRLEEKDASITQTICELNGFKPTTLRRRPRQMYPEWDDQNRNRNNNRTEEKEVTTRQELEQDGDVVKRSDLVSHFLKLKSNKKFASGNNKWERDTEEDSYKNYNKGGKVSPTEKSEKFNSGVNRNKISDRDEFEDNEDHLLEGNSGVLPMRNSSLRFCGGTIDIKDIFRRKKEAQELSPKMNNKVTTNLSGRKIYPKTINLTKNLVRDPVVLDPGSQPTFLAEKHRYHHRSHPNLTTYADEEELDRERVEEARRNMKYNQRNCDSSTPSQRSFEDHDYEVIEYQDVQLRGKQPQKVKRSNTTVGRAKSVRINPVADMIQDQVPRNGYSKWKSDRSSMPPVVGSPPTSPGKPSKDKFNTISPSSAAALTRSSPSSSQSSGEGKSSPVRRSKSINPKSFIENWSRRHQQPRPVREESEYENAVAPPPPPSRSPPVPPPVAVSGAVSPTIRHQPSMRQINNNNSSKPVIEIKQKLVQHSPPPVLSEKKKIASEVNSDDQDQFMIPRPRLIVPVHTYARKRRTGNLRADVAAEEDGTGAATDEGN